MVAFYGCLLAEVVPVPIEVPLSRKVLNKISRPVYTAVCVDSDSADCVFRSDLFLRM